MTYKDRAAKAGSTIFNFFTHPWAIRGVLVFVTAWLIIAGLGFLLDKIMTLNIGGTLGHIVNGVVTGLEPLSESLFTVAIMLFGAWIIFRKVFGKSKGKR